MLPPFFYWDKRKVKKIHPEEVIALQAGKNYITVILQDKPSCQIRSTLIDMLRKLPPDVFIRTHRSYAVSLYYIDNIVYDHASIGKLSIPIAKRYYKKVINQLNIIGGQED